MRITNPLKCCCVVCIKHISVGASCICNKCIPHLMHDNTICSCVIENNKPNEHTKLQIITNSDEQKKNYVKMYKKLNDLNYDQKKHILYTNIDRYAVNIVTTSNIKIKESREDEFKKKQANNSKKYRAKQKTKMINDDHNRELPKNQSTNTQCPNNSDNCIQQEYPQKVHAPPIDAKTRKQTYKEKNIQIYGEEGYKKILAVQKKIERYKKTGKSDEIKKATEELETLKKKN